MADGSMPTSEAAELLKSASSPDPTTKPVGQVAGRRGGARPGAGRKPKATGGRAPGGNRAARPEPAEDEDEKPKGPSAEALKSARTINRSVGHLAVGFLGEELRPTPAEADELDQAAAAYMDQRGVINAPPEMELFTAYSAVYGPKCRRPSVREVLTLYALRLRNSFHALRARFQRRK